LTDIQAALGASQLDKLDRFVRMRTERADRYRELLGGTAGLVLPPAAPPGHRHAYHLFAIQVADRARVHADLHERGIGVQVHFVPTYHFGAYADLGLSPADFPATEAVYAGLLSLPLYPDLTEQDQQQVVDKLLAVL
jgi:dTDP-4-amino-4,6-dideoxygalactose transaminase